MTIIYKYRGDDPMLKDTVFIDAEINTDANALFKVTGAAVKETIIRYVPSYNFIRANKQNMYYLSWVGFISDWIIDANGELS